MCLYFFLIRKIYANITINDDNVHKVTALLKLSTFYIFEWVLKTTNEYNVVYTIEMLEYQRKYFKVIKDTIINNGSKLLMTMVM
jgi:hypothetical protein